MSCHRYLKMKMNSRSKTRPTKRAPDVGDSPRQQTFSTPEANPLAKGKASPAPRR